MPLPSRKFRRGYITYQKSKLTGNKVKIQTHDSNSISEFFPLADKAFLKIQLEHQESEIMSLDKVKVVCKEPNNPDVKDSALNVKQLATPFKNLIYKSCFIKLAFAYKILSRQSG